MAAVPSLPPFTSTTQLARCLASSLDAVKPDAPFACSGIYDHVSNDGFQVKDAGTFTLPLQEDSLRRLIRAADTVSDSYGRPISSGSYEIDAKLVTFLDPVWNLHEELLGEIRTTLGIDSPYVRADFRHIAIRGENEEPPYMPQGRRYYGNFTSIFGALSISLPCEHTGGDVIVAHKGQYMRLKTSSESSTTHNYLAYLTGSMPERKLYDYGNQRSHLIPDFTYKSDTVSSGTRVTLEYNLIYEGRGPAPSPGDCGRSLQQLRTTLERWQAAEKGVTLPCMLYALQPSLADATLLPTSLRGNDAARYEALTTIGRDLGFLCYLESIEQAREDRMYRRKLEVLLDQLTVKRLYDGHHLDLSVNLYNSAVAQWNWWAERQAGQKRAIFHEATTSGLYTSQALLILKQDFRIGFLGLSDDMTSILEAEIAALQEDTDDQERRRGLEKLCTSMIDENTEALAEACPRSYLQRTFCTVPYSDEDIGVAAKAFLVMQDADLFGSTLEATKRWLPTGVFHEAGKLMAEVSDPTLVEHLKTAFAQYTHSRDKVKAVQNLLFGCTEAMGGGELDVECANLAETFFDEVLKHETKLGRDIASACIYVASHIGYKKKTLAIVRRLADFARTSPSFAVSCAQKLQILTTSGSIGTDVFLVFVRRMLPHVLLTPRLRDTPSAFLPSYRRHGEEVMSIDTLKDLYTLLAGLETPELVDTLLQDLKNFATMIRSAQSEFFHTHLFPFLGHAVDAVDDDTASISESGHDSEESSLLEELLQSTLFCYAINYVRREPAKPTTWVQAKEGCGKSDCDPCRELDQFLTSDAFEADFAFPEAKRKHLAQQLGVASPHNRTSCFITSIDKSGRPYALVVQKTLRGWKRSHEYWQRRVERAKEQLSALKSRLDGSLTIDSWSQLVLDGDLSGFWKAMAQHDVAATAKTEAAKQVKNKEKIESSSKTAPAALGKASTNAKVKANKDAVSKPTTAKRKADGKENAARKKTRARA